MSADDRFFALPFLALLAGAVLLAALGPGATAQDEHDVTIELSAMRSAFGTEVYKENDRANTRTPDDFENQTTNWNVALGHSVTFTFQVSAGAEPLDCDDRFIPEAYILVGSTRLYGWTNGAVATNVPPTVCATGPPGERRFEVTFDLDGAPPSVTGSEFHPVGNGLQLATLDLYHTVTPTLNNLAGKGPLAGSTMVAFTVANPQLSLPEPFALFPESTLRMFADVGAASGSKDVFAMPTRSFPTAGETNLTIRFPGAPLGVEFDRVDHWAARLAPGADLPTGVPEGVSDPTGLDELAGKVDDATDRDPLVNITAVRFLLTNNTVPPSRAVTMPVRGADFHSPAPAPGGFAYVPLPVVTIHLPADLTNRTTGASSFIMPVSDRVYEVKELAASRLVGPLSETGSTHITLRDGEELSGGESGRNAGDMFALRDAGGAFDVLTKGRLAREPGSEWVTGELAHLGFPAGTAAYTVQSILYGGNDEFLGMGLVRRGIGLDVGDVRVVEGRSGSIAVTVTNLADDYDAAAGEDDYTISVNLVGEGVPGNSLYNVTIEDIPEGQSRRVVVDLVGGAPGTYSARFVATSGELEADNSATVQVISREDARDANRRWYDIPAPSALLPALAAALALGLAMRRRPA